MFERLRAIQNLRLAENVPLSRHTRFALGGPARVLADASSEDALIAAVRLARDRQWPLTLIGGGSNLVVSDEGFPGIALRYTDASRTIEGNRIHVGAGAVLQNLVDASIAAGLEGLHTMTRIPGWVGGAVYGNAGAYGHSLHEFVESVRFFDGGRVREIGNAECEFRYRESVFKQRKDWIVLGTTLRLPSGDPTVLAGAADEIAKIRDEKFPPTLCCAGSIFKNLLLAELPQSVRALVPERVIREGKVPSAYFLEQVGAKGMSIGGIQVASYHANLLYNAGGGTALAVRQLIDILKDRVQTQFGLRLEEEVQYVNFALSPQLATDSKG